MDMIAATLPTYPCFSVLLLTAAEEEGQEADDVSRCVDEEAPGGADPEEEVSWVGDEEDMGYGGHDEVADDSEHEREFLE
ncbi:hypothetical protein TRIUR3_28365 [Triticum urartu]|uniref:Uncharacterized protein n=1 Tax=Triticum urartu TaxID=4572 RepID=M7ZZH3_TRIUA|nr:hypothetical protein TRIUR3_28365 [Triticum urartu]